MAKQLKGGYLLRYKKKIFGKAWKEEWVVLYDNSSLVWYKDRDRPSPEGGMLLSEAPELLAVGLWTLRIPCRPDLPDGCHTRQLMAFGTPGKEKVHWFLCKSEDEVNEWMTAISNTLPPPPTMPKSDDVISTPSRLKKTEILTHLAHHKSADLINSSCLVDYHLPKTTSLGNGIMNSCHSLKNPTSSLATNGKTGSMTAIYPQQQHHAHSNSHHHHHQQQQQHSQRPLATSKTANNGLTNGHSKSHHHHHHSRSHHNSHQNGSTSSSTTGLIGHGSSSTLSSMDTSTTSTSSTVAKANGHHHHAAAGKQNGVTPPSSSSTTGRGTSTAAADAGFTSALTMSTALGYWSHGFGWGWGPGWGWSGWGVNSLLSKDYGGFRTGIFDHTSGTYHGGSGSGCNNGHTHHDSSSYGHLDSSTGGFGDFAENIDMGLGSAGLDDSLLDSAGSAWDAFGGDFGF